MTPEEMEKANCSACQKGDRANHDAGHPTATTPRPNTRGGAR